MTRKKREDKVQTKKDTGIATVAAPMSTGEVKTFKISEEIRDILNKTKGRPKVLPGENPDLMTKNDLERVRYSGYRLNELAGQIELWCDGRLMCYRNAQRAANNPGILAEMHEEAFHTVGSIVQVDVPVKRCSCTYNDVNPKCPTHGTFGQKKEMH